MDKKDILSRVDHTLLSQTATWEEIRQILKRMAGQLLQTDHSTYTDACFRRTDACSQELHREIEQFLQNHTWQNEISFAR